MEQPDDRDCEIVSVAQIASKLKKLKRKRQALEEEEKRATETLTTVQCELLSVRERLKKFKRTPVKLLMSLDEAEQIFIALIERKRAKTERRAAKLRVQAEEECWAFERICDMTGCRVKPIGLYSPGLAKHFAGDKWLRGKKLDPNVWALGCEGENGIGRISEREEEALHILGVKWKVKVVDGLIGVA